MKPLTTLTEVREYLTSIPEIDCGGCGISALSMYKWLENNNQLKSDTKIVFLHYPQWMLECCKNMQIEKGELNEEPHGANHVGMYHDGKYFDCRFDFTQDCYDLIHETNNIDFVKRSLNNISEWNGSFNRSKYVPEIENTLMVELNINLK